MKTRVLLTLLAALSAFSFAHAQSESTGITMTTQGISGDSDKQDRDPILTVQTMAGATSATILVDAYVNNGEYKKYPIQFDFYVNRSLFASQTRSTELPGPIGVTVDYKTAPIPFNYSVIARVLHPNRTFTTVLNAAVERIDPTPVPGGTTIAAKCTLKETLDGETLTYSNDKVTISEKDTQISASFVATDTADSTSTLTLTLAATENASALSGTLKVDDGSGSPVDETITGSYVKTSGTLSSVTATSSDSKYTLQCDKL